MLVMKKKKEYMVVLYLLNDSRKNISETCDKQAAIMRTDARNPRYRCYI